AVGGGVAVGGGRDQDEVVGGRLRQPVGLRDPCAETVGDGAAGEEVEDGAERGLPRVGGPGSPRVGGGEEGDGYDLVVGAGGIEQGGECGMERRGVGGGEAEVPRGGGEVVHAEGADVRAPRALRHARGGEGELEER